LNLGHTGLDSDGFRRWISEAGVRPIYFVHDLIPLTHPEFCRSGEADHHQKRMRTVLSTASGIIGNSQATLDDLHHFATTEGLCLPPAVAAWLGCTAIQTCSGVSAEPSRPTFVALGTIEARKNHMMLLRMWSRLVARLGMEVPRLLIIGQRGWEAEDVFRVLDTNKSLRGHVVELTSCSDEEIAQHLASARALLFPSNAEGYGLPLIEALGLGSPVIASNLPVFREIGQDVPLLLDARDEGAWEAAILDFAQSRSVLREEQLRRLQSFRLPTWAEHFEAIENWLSAIG
jgi:glycosyltransferase involved in cell wall biosynthesis